MVNPLYFVVPEPMGLVTHYARITGDSGLGAIVFSTDRQVCDERHLEALAAIDALDA